MENNSKIPKWKSMDQKELSHQYSCSAWSRRYSSTEIIRKHVEEAERKSREVIQDKRIERRTDVPYDQKETTKLDVFGEDLKNDSAILVYVHGGYWQELSKNSSLYPVRPLYDASILTIVPDYTLAPKARLDEIVSETRLCVRWACDLARKRGAKGVILMGHSAGAHLITEVLCTAEETGDLELFKTVRGVVAISGVFDIRPLVQTYINDPLKLDEATAWELSPLKKVSKLSASLPSVRALVAVGGDESPEFRRQTKELGEELLRNNIATSILEFDQEDHFSLPESLASSDAEFTSIVIKFIQECVQKH